MDDYVFSMRSEYPLTKKAVRIREAFFSMFGDPRSPHSVNKITTRFRYL